MKKLSIVAAFVALVAWPVSTAFSAAICGDLTDCLSAPQCVGQVCNAPDACILGGVVHDCVAIRYGGLLGQTCCCVCQRAVPASSTVMLTLLSVGVLGIGAWQRRRVHA